MKGVGLFAGAGGFEVAAEQAGIEVIYAANHWPLAVAVHAANHPSAEHSCQDVTMLDFNTLDPFDFLFAGVACQGHSRGGRQGRKSSKKVEADHAKLRATAWCVVKCLEICRPRFFIVENVPEFLDWTLLDPWLACLRKLGYAVTTQVLCASRWGVGQRRSRMFVVGVHEGPHVAVQDPDVEETGVAQIFDPAAKDWKRISDMRKTTSKSGYKTAREKAEYANERLGGELGWGQHTNYGAWGLPLSTPCPTLTTCPAHMWWVRDGYYRLWTRGELAAAQSFPASYDFLDANKKDEARLIGNAVPPKLAEGVIREVLRQAA